MARQAKNIESNVSFGEYEAPEVINPFSDTVAQFVEHVENGHPNATMNVTVDVEDEASTKHKIQRAANDLGKTAKHRFTDDSGVKVTGRDEDGDPIREGKVTLTFTLSEKHKARRGRGPAKPKPEAEAK